jgi:ribose/xylose/arabinose/galactoside ABC-type transport system permease subunit
VGEKRIGGAILRPHSVPEQLGLAGVAAAAASFVYPAASHATGLGLPCPLRTLTGVPCPLCGMTTAATGLAAGDLRAALAANPFVLALAAGTLCMSVLLAVRAAGLAPAPAPWSRTARRRAWWAVALLAAASWAFQLHRFGWL